VEDALATIQSRTFNSHHWLVIASKELKGESLRLLGWDVEPAGARSTPIRTAGRRQEASMNHSIYSADRSTHLKIVVVALVAGIAVAGFGISARTSSDDYTQTARVMKAGKAMAITSSETSTVR
jgi:hypothetical protein